MRHDKIKYRKPAILLLLFLIGFSTLGGLFGISKGSTDTALAYLKTKPPGPWITMALVAAEGNADVTYLKNVSGDTAISLEAPILAITAAGKDPRSFPSENLIAKLKKFYDGTQIGDSALLNDDVFGILALASAGEAAADPVLAGAKDFLLEHQNTDGGWSYAKGGPSDTNSTAAAVMALLFVGLPKDHEVITRAIAYLKNAQNNDGGFPYNPESQWGNASDASSDTWVIAMLNKLGEDPRMWIKSGNNPVAHLESLQTPAGYYAYQPGSSEDSFSSVTTAYAIIALSGKSFPLRTIAPASKELAHVRYRIEGEEATLCAGETDVETALDIIKVAADSCRLTYHIQATSFGPYVDEISGEKAQGSRGWLYLVNFTPPDVGAGDFLLQTGDEVIWYYGEFSWKPLRLTLNASHIASEESIIAKVETFEQGEWKPLEGANIFGYPGSIMTDITGQAALIFSDGTYTVFAEKAGYLRSNQEHLWVGAPSESRLELSLTLEGSQELSTSTVKTIAFSIQTETGSPRLDFGTLAPGLARSKTITFANQGDVSLEITSELSGDDVFRSYLSIDAKPWRMFRAALGQGLTKYAVLRIKIPTEFKEQGTKTGTLVFWATPSLSP
ncbi:MAG: DUF4430 domain-containing protein [Parcubacteria group bacterium]|nr:DUF4430 domain-containing protein [Parcubacteria group bacterium]